MHQTCVGIRFTKKLKTIIFAPVKGSQHTLHAKKEFLSICFPTEMEETRIIGLKMEFHISGVALLLGP